MMGKEEGRIREWARRCQKGWRDEKEQPWGKRTFNNVPGD